MLKKTITYKDYNGNERTEDFYFNLTPAEITEMEMRASGGLEAVLNRIISEQDTEKMIEHFKTIILASYGVKSTDGRNFVKNDRVREDFQSTNAYSQLFMELATNDKAASDFIQAIMPKQSEIPTLAERQSSPSTNVTPLPGPISSTPDPIALEEEMNKRIDDLVAKRLAAMTNPNQEFADEVIAN